MNERRPTRNERLRRAREARNLTQADVARLLGTSTLTVSRWELGVQAPQPNHRDRLCRLYGATAQDLGIMPPAPSPDGPQPVDPSAERGRRDLLAQVQAYWAGAQLEAGTRLISDLRLSLVERLDAVDDPRRVIPRRHHDDRPLPPNASIGAVFRQLGEQLLILGDPGAGKTTLMLLLCRELLDARDRLESDPMPVVFHLSSWATQRQPLARWLIDELHRRYGVARWLGERWIAQEQVVPLLDGLDEVADSHRAACVTAINEFRTRHGQLPMVVCCRSDAYESLQLKLNIRGALVILPLSHAELRRQLRGAGDALAGLAQHVEDDAQLRELLTTPLLLNVATLTYGHRTIGSVSSHGTLTDRRRQVLGDYVNAVLRASSVDSGPSREESIAWLGWLARAMRSHDQSIFYPDWLQPSWLPKGGRPWIVTHGVSLAIGLASGLLVGVNWGVDWGLSLGVGPACLVGVTIGALVAFFHGVVAHESHIRPAEQIRWSWRALRRGIPRWLGIGMIVGVLSGLLFGLVLTVSFAATPDVLAGPRAAGAERATGGHGLLVTVVTGVASGLVNGAGLGLTIGLTFGLLSGLDARSGVDLLAPGKSVEASRRNALVSGVAGACVFGLCFGLAYGWGTSLTGALVQSSAHKLGLAGIYWPVAAANDLLVAALIGAMIAGLQRGGGAYIRHRALIWILVRTGCMPRDYIAFLEHAARLVLLRRRGGGYEFMHHLLLDHFAELEVGPATERRR